MEGANSSADQEIGLAPGALREGRPAAQDGAGNALTEWRRAYDTLFAMKRRGRFISPQDERFLTQLRAKVGG